MLAAVRVGRPDVPADYPAFRRYFDRVCAEELEMTPAAARFQELFDRPGTMAQPWIPAWSWRLLAPFAAVPRAVSVVALPPAVLEALGYRSTAAQGVVLRVVRAAVRLVWPVLPRRWRYVERARTAFARG